MISHKQTVEDKTSHTNAYRLQVESRDRRENSGVEKRVNNLFSLFHSGVKATQKQVDTGMILSRIDYKLAQRLDSIGNPRLAEEVRTISERRKISIIAGAVAFIRRRTLSQWLGMGAGVMALSLVSCGLLAFGLVYYRGMDVPILRDFAEQNPPVLALSKSVETEYGVGASGNTFTVGVQNGVMFRSLGLENKISINPPVSFDVEVASDLGSVKIVPQEELAADTEYTVTLRNGTMFSDGTSLSEDYSWTFRTEPEFRVTGITPRDGTSSAPYDTAIEVEFTYKDLDVETFRNYFEIVPEVEGRFELIGKKIVFIPSRELVPNSEYSVTVKSGFSNEQGDVITDAVTSSFRVSSLTSAGVYVEHPYMDWSEHTPVLSTTQEPWVAMYSYDLEGSVSFTLYRAQKDALVEALKDYRWDFSQKPSDRYLEKVREFSLTPSETDFFKVDLNDYGIYLLEAYNASYGRSIYKFLVFSPLGIIYSDSNENTQVWLSNMNDKSPVGGGIVNYYDVDKSDSPVASGNTDNNGYSQNEDAGIDLAIVEFVGNYAIGGSYMRNEYWWYGGDGLGMGGYGDVGYRAFVYTDRPLYRPGDTVRYKTILRDEDDMTYSIPESREVTMRMGESTYLWNGRTQVPYFEETFEVSKDFGTVSGEFVIPANMQTGYQVLNAVVDGVAVGSASFTVAEFEKPRYQYSLSLDKTLAFSGDTLTVEITGTDYSGDPASGQKVGMWISKSEVTAGNWIENPEEFQSYSYVDGSPLIEETITLDSNGYAEYSIPLDTNGYSTGLASYQISIWSKENYGTHDSKSVLVAESSYGLYVKAKESSVKEGTDNEMTFRTAHLWDMQPEGGVRVKYDVKRSWTEWVENGDYYDPLTKSRKPLYRATTVHSDVLMNQELTTDADGYGTVTFSGLERGTYTVTATYYSGSSTFLRRFSYVFYVYEPPETDEPMFSDWDSSWQKFKIYTDKEEYSPGDTAHIAIKTTLKGEGLYMIRRGTVSAWRVADFSTGFLEIQQEITSGMSPYVEICAWGIDEYVTSGSMVTGERGIYLSNVYKNDCVPVYVNEDRGRLSVTITPDQELYEPGDRVSLAVSTTDRSGNGVESEVSVSVVDKALLDLSRNQTGNSTGVYESFYETVRQHVFQVGFPFEYNYYGFAGGGGGGEPVRSNFEDAAFWNGKVKTDAKGRGKVTFTLPDNLTTWAAQAVAVTTDTKVGEGTVEFIARKDVRLDALVPDYLRSGDEWVLDLDAVNYSGNSLAAKIEINCDGCVQQTYLSEKTVGSGRREQVAVTLVPETNAKEIVVTGSLSASSENTDSEYYDNVKWNIPILREGFERSETQSVLLDGNSKSGTLDMTIPEDSNVDRATLVLTASRSYLNEWALVPIDPTVSSSVDLSSSIIHNSFFVEHFSKIKPATERSVFSQKVQTSLDLLEKNQANDGGFGWFDYDAVNYEVSCYVAIALSHALDAGFSVESERLQSLKLFISDGLESDARSIDERIYGLYALSVLGDRSVLPPALSVKSRVSEFSSSPLNIAYLMLTFEVLGSQGDAGELAKYLEETATLSTRGASWQEPDSTSRIVRSQEYVTSVVLRALYPFDSMEVYQKARTWLLENPVDVYGNTPDAVAVFHALASTSLESMTERQDSVTVEVRVNGQSQKIFEVAGGTVNTGTVSLSVDSQDLVSGRNKIDISSNGDGMVYVVANMTYATGSIDDISEFTVTRTVADFSSSSPVATVKKGSVVLIRTAVTVDRDGYNLVVTDMLPSGFEPVRYTLGDFDYAFYRRWWKWGDGNYVNRYGSPASDRVTFTEYEVKDGKTYTFEYPAVATYTGTFSGGGARAYLQGFGDVGGNALTPHIIVTK